MHKLQLGKKNMWDAKRDFMCRNGKNRARNRARGPSPRKGKDPPTHCPYPTHG